MTMLSTDATMLAFMLDTDIFAGVDKKIVTEILSNPNVKRVVLSKGQYIYHHGDISDRFWIILTGEIVAQVQSLRHPFHKLQHSPGDVTGLMGIVDPGKPRPVSMVADGDVELVEIPGEVVLDMDSAAWGAILSNIARILLHRLLECHSNMDH